MSSVLVEIVLFDVVSNSSNVTPLPRPHGKEPVATGVASTTDGALALDVLPSEGEEEVEDKWERMLSHPAGERHSWGSPRIDWCHNREPFILVIIVLVIIVLVLRLFPLSILLRRCLRVETVKDHALL